MLRLADVRELVTAGDDDPVSIALRLTGYAGLEEVEEAEVLIEQVYLEWTMTNQQDLQNE